MAFVIFLFLSNLLVAEFKRSGVGQKRGWAWALSDVFTFANFEIAVVAALASYILFEYLRQRLWRSAATDQRCVNSSLCTTNSG